MGDKYLDKVDTKRVKKEAWIDIYRIMAIETDRSDIINILKNYEDMDEKEAETMFENIKKAQTSEALFSIGYLEDILMLLTELDISTGHVRISLGTNSPISFVVEDEHGSLTIHLAPRIGKEKEE
jgi:hypothetical protein